MSAKLHISVGTKSCNFDINIVQTRRQMQKVEFDKGLNGL